jgi:CheY-like chemotaxis protein
MAHILVVDDDDFFSTLLVNMLGVDGHTVSTADDGLEALKMLMHKRVDVIMTDILMPHMDGVEFILALSKSEHPAPVIAMSGGRRSITPEFNLDSARLLGVKATLTKPFSHADLRKALAKVLG